MIHFANFVSRVLQIVLTSVFNVQLSNQFSRNFAKAPGSRVVSPLLTLFSVGIRDLKNQRPRELENQRTRELEILLNLENFTTLRGKLCFFSSYTNTKFYFYRYQIFFISIHFQLSCSFTYQTGFYLLSSNKS